MNYTDKYSSLRILDDPTNGKVRLGLVDRLNSDRKTKISNNFVSQLSVLEPDVLKLVIQKLNAKLPEPTPGEKITGMQYSGIPMATALGMERKSNFVLSSDINFDNRPDLFSFSQDHRNNKTYYFYGINPNDTVIIVEDEVTSGNGLVALVKALRKYGVKVVAVCCAIENVTFRARDILKQETDLDLISLIRIEVS